MKRSFSLSELQQAIQTSEFSSPRSITEANGTSEAHLSESVAKLSTMRRSKSMDHLNEFGEPSFPSPQVVLPSLSSLGLSFAAQQHGYEELKRGRGLHGKLPTSSSNSSLVNMVSGAENDLFGISEAAQCKEESGQDDETRGAASALMELFAQPSVNASSRPQPTASEQQQARPAAHVAEGMPKMVLPPLRELIAASQAGHTDAGASTPADRKVEPEIASHHGVLSDQSQSPAARVPPVKIEGGDNGSPLAVNRRLDVPGSPTPQPEALDLGSPGATGADSTDAKHNKYCHFCQHVKVKRATSMLACENPECARRFCEHCLVTHLLHVVPPDGRGLREPLDGKWLCPICRKVCCCAIQNCARSHRHCKAYRYRQRRAEQAARRSLAAAANDAVSNQPGPGPCFQVPVSSQHPALHSSPGPVAHGPGPAPGQGMMGGAGERPGMAIGVGMGGMPVLRPGPGGVPPQMMGHVPRGFGMPPDMGLGMGVMMAGMGPGFVPPGGRAPPGVYARNL